MDVGKFRAFQNGANRVVSAVFLIFFTSPLWAMPVFINELHYDDQGADSGEGVEISGPAGTDLNNWQLLFYNGGNGEVYKTLTLSGLIPDAGSGMGFMAASVSGIQNGAPDGLALINDQGGVIQFLSYEGTFSATNGAANGLLSNDIGVIQDGSTIEGLTLQLAGVGSGSEDFHWTTDQESFGAVNIGQTFVAQIQPVPLPGALGLLCSGLIALSACGRNRKRAIA